MKKQAPAAPELFLGRYEILARLGGGASSEVLKARDSVRGIDVALKLYASRDPSFLPLFKNEFRLLAGLSHPNLAAVFDYGMTPDNRPYFTMEFLDGSPIVPADLRDASGGLDARKLYAILEQLARVLDYVHANNILHGDIKPANIFLLRESAPDAPPRVKLVDFGLGRLRSEGGESGGTIEYVAPEAIRREETDARTDLYALGAVLYELLAGRPPFTGGTPREILLKHLREVPRPVRELAPAVSQDMSACVHQLLEKNPSFRPHSAFELLQAIARATGREAAAGEIPERQVPLRSRIRRERERAKIAEILAGAAGTPAILILEGDRGVGKSTMLRELLAEFQLEERRVFHFAARAGSEPFAPLLRLLGQLREETGGTRDEEWRVVAALFPRDFPMEGVALSRLDAAAEKFRLFHAVAAILAVGSPQGTHFLFDDIHELDALSREFLEYFAGYLEANAAAGCFCLWTADPSEEREEIKRLKQSPLAVALRLPPFTPAETAEYVQSLFDKAASPSFIQALHKQSGGNPLFLEEVLAFCQGNGIVERTAHGWQIHEQENLPRLFPASLADMFARKIEGLGADDRRALEAMAVSPEAVPFDLLSYVTGFSAERLTAALRQATRRQLVREEDGVFAIARPEILPLIRRGTDPAASTELHDRTIAYHVNHGTLAALDAAGAASLYLGSSQRAAALPHLTAAAAEAARRFAHDAAARHYAAALEFLDPDRNKEERFEILLHLIDAHHALSRRDGAAECIEEAMVLAARLNDSARLASVYQRQVEHFIAADEMDRARKSAEKALSLFESTGDAAGAARCLARIGWIHYRNRQGEELRRYYDRALRAYESIARPVDEGNALVEYGLAHYFVLDEPQKALDLFAKARLRFESVADRPGIARTLGNTGIQKFHLGQFAEAIDCYDEAQGLYAEVGDRRGVAYASHALGQAYLAIGRFSDAMRSLHEGLRVAIEIRDLHAQERALESLGELHLMLGAYEQAIGHYTRARAIAERIGNGVGIATNDYDIAGAHIERREFEKAWALLLQARERLAGIEDANAAAWLEYRFGTYFLALGKPDQIGKAVEHFRLLGEIADRHNFESLQIIARSYLALAHALGGNLDQAAKLSSSALDLLFRAGALRGGSQDISYHHARILRAQNKHAEAAAYIAQAYDELMARAKTIADSALYRNFVSDVRLHAEIIREHDALHRGDAVRQESAVRERNLKALYEVSRSINSILDLPRLLERIMDSALQTMNGERGMLFLIEGDRLNLVVARNVEAETISDATEISLSIMNDVIHGGAPIIVSDAQEDAAFRDRQSVRNFRIRSLICVPLRSRDALIGTVYVDSRMDAFHAVQFSEIDMEFLEAFANLAAIAIENARLHDRLKEENLYLRKEVEERFGFESIVGQSKPMLRLYQEIRGAIASEGSVLVMGESGTGKELVARAIHYNGPRKARHFVPLDCGALPDTLLESELFGYRKGAFTGAYTDKRGLFEEAHLGTLFLDEISNTSLAFQAKLLRILQEGEYRRVGDTESRFVNVRIVCATNRDLKQEIAEGRFRQDLFFRLNVIPISVPPLRDRQSDIPLLLQHFIDLHNKSSNAPIRGISRELVEYFCSLPWPGNVRELENIVSRMVVYAGNDLLSLKQLPPDFTESQPASAEKSPISFNIKPSKRVMTLRDAEREHISYVLQLTKGNKTEAAKILDIKRTTLVERMKKLGMM